MIELGSLVESITNEDKLLFNKFVIDRMLGEDLFVKVLDEFLPSHLFEMSLEERKEYITYMVVGNTSRNYLLYAIALMYLQKEVDRNAENFLDIARLDKFKNVEKICKEMWK